MSARAVRIGAVWDSTVEVLRGRAGILTTLAAIYLFAPAVVPALLGLATGGMVPAVLGGLLSLAQLVLTIVALLAIAAVASDPGMDGARAQAVGWRRLDAGVIATLAIVAGVFVALIPLALVATAFGVRANPGGGTLDVRAVSTAGLATVTISTLVVAALALWISARLLLVMPVVANEPLSLGALRRSVALTRGAGGRLVGVALLYVLVAGVVTSATTSVVGVVAQLMLGEGAATLLVAAAAAAVGAATAVLQGVFAARFYIAARGAQA